MKAKFQQEQTGQFKKSLKELGLRALLIVAIGLAGEVLFYLRKIFLNYV